MVYHRGWNYYVRNGLLRGLLKGYWVRTGALHKIAQTYTDGALARHYSVSEWHSLASKYLYIKSVRIFGRKLDLIVLPGVRIKNVLTALIPDRLARLAMNKWRLGRTWSRHWKRRPRRVRGWSPHGTIISPRGRGRLTRWRSRTAAPMEELAARDFGQPVEGEGGGGGATGLRTETINLACG